VSGGSSHINTFDQNVPGFSVTFLHRQRCLGVLARAARRARLGHARPPAHDARLREQRVGAKLLARFLVGVIPDAPAVRGRPRALGMSLGPQPWLLLLPTAGIVFAGTAFGLVVQTSPPAVRRYCRSARSPSSPAAVGGCWWPIDLEPRWMRQVALAFPTTWAMEAFNDLMIRRRGIEAALRPTAVMAAFGVLYLLVGTAVFRRRLTRT
jgi:hypothetical protein